MPRAMSSDSINLSGVFPTGHFDGITYFYHFCSLCCYDSKTQETFSMALHLRQIFHMEQDSRQGK